MGGISDNKLLFNNNKLLFKNNRLLFSLLFSTNFCGDKALMEGDKALMDGDKVVIGGSLPPGKTLVLTQSIFLGREYYSKQAG